MAYAPRTKPWQTLATAPTAEGTLELRRRGDDFLIVIGGRVLMNSASRRSEEALAELALAGRSARRVLIGGLGMGFTLRAALDVLDAGARVTVAELDAAVLAWCEGPLAAANGRAVRDPRVAVVIADVAHVIARARPASLDAILLDLYEGPYRGAGCFGGEGLAQIRAALAAGGVLAVWSEDDAPAFVRRLERAGFTARRHRAGTGRTHVVYCAAARAGRDSR